MPATLDQFPEELYKLILDYAEAADMRWEPLGFAQSELVVAEGAQHGGLHDVSEGLWTSWYGRGVFALAHVDKRWNALARPILFKSLDLMLVGSDFFGLHVLGEPLGRHVQQLRLDIVSMAGVPYLALAGALRKLPNVTSFVLSSLMLSRLKRDVRSSPTAQEVETRLWAALYGASTVEVGPSSVQGLVDVIGRVHPMRLRSLTLDFARYADGDGNEVKATEALQLLTGLRSLSLMNVWRAHVVAWSSSTVLPRLRTLTIRAGWPLEQGLRLAASLAPNVETLSVCVVGFSGVVIFPSHLDHPPLSFPHLRLLVLDGIVTFPTGLLFLPLCKLESLRVKLVKIDDYDVYIPSTFPYRLPIALREVVVSSPTDADRWGLDALEAACIQHDVAFVARQHVGPVSRRPVAASGARAVVAPPTPGQAAQVQDTLDWAMERTRWLVELEDGPGLQEMAEATERLRERRVIERS